VACGRGVARLLSAGAARPDPLAEPAGPFVATAAVIVGAGEGEAAGGLLLQAMRTRPQKHRHDQSEPVDESQLHWQNTLGHRGAARIRAIMQIASPTAEGKLVGRSGRTACADHACWRGRSRPDGDEPAVP